MTPLGQCLGKISEASLTRERREELWAELEQTYAALSSSSPPPPPPHIAKSFKGQTADNIGYRLNSVARVFQATPAIFVEFFGSRAILTRNSLHYLRALKSQRPATTFVELLSAFERIQPLGASVTPANHLKQAIQNIHPDAVINRLSRRETPSVMSSQADQEAIPVEADSAPTSVAKLEASAETDITTSAVPIDPVLTTEQPPPLAHRLGTLKASQKADGRHQFPFTHQESQPKPPSTPHLNRNPPTQASIIMSDSPSRLFDTAIDESDGTSTGSLDIGSFNSFLGSAIASTPRNRKKSTNMLDAGTPHQATTLSPKKRPSSSQEDGAPAPKRHRQDAGGDGPREETTPAHAPPLHITLESLAESWHRLDKDWLDDRIVNLFISRLATASVGTVDSLILSSPTQNSRTLRRLAPLREKDTLLMPFFSDEHWRLFRFV
ncbi:hypothetical protein LY78DRAFT_534581, partial [Colletotrichum sublineola]